MIRGEGTIAVRDAADGDGRTAEGIAVPYGVPVSGPTAEYGNAAEVFERGAFADYVAGGGQLAFLDRHDGVVIGMSSELEERDDGLAYRGRLFGSQAAADYAERVAGGMRAVSIEFTPGKVRRSAGKVSHYAGAIAHGIAGTYRPAYQGATVALRETAMTTETAPEAPAESAVIPFDEARVTSIARTIARGELERAERSFAERALERGDASPHAGIRTIGELMARGFDRPKGDPLLNWSAAVARRALANQTIADNPGVTTPGAMGQVRGIIGASRPVVNAFGTDDPDGAGLVVSWPYTVVDIATLVGVQATEKAEILSVKVPILSKNATLVTYAGGSDISYQLIRRSTPSYIEAYARIMTAAWSYTTDLAFTNAILATVGLGTLPDLGAAATTNQIMGAIFAASVKVEAATGSPAAFVLAGSDVFVYTGAGLYPGPTQNQAGGASARTLRADIADLPIIHAPHLPPKAMLVSNSQAAAWIEEGPFQAVAEDVAHLGQDRAIWSMGTAGVYVPAGIVRINQAAAAGATASAGK